jgi:hypothetical protein
LTAVVFLLILFFAAQAYADTKRLPAAHSVDKYGLIFSKRASEIPFIARRPSIF